MVDKEILTSDPRTARGLISLKTAARLVDVEPKTIRNWIAAGLLQGYKLNEQLWRVERREVLALARPIPFEPSSDGAA